MNLCSNAENGYVRMRNISSFILYFEVDYTIGATEYSDDSRILRRGGDVVLIHIPGVASKIMVRVYISNGDLVWSLAFQLKYKIPADYCFDVSGDFASPNLTRVPCLG